MTVNRTKIDRHRLRPTVDAETLELFISLEATPKRLRHSQKFKNDESALHRKLDLYSEFFLSGGGCNVLDGGPAPFWNPIYVINGDWRKAREMRVALKRLASSASPP